VISDRDVHQLAARGRRHTFFFTASCSA
jgi:hypothetical protein